MKESLLRHAANLKQKNHLHKRWQKVVSVLACMVVFCTVYALVLPAVTMEKTAYCGKEEHSHTETCFENQLICAKADGEGAHQHSDQCNETTQILICTVPESDGHQHTEECYATTTEDILVCESDDPEHVHGSECYSTVTVTAETPSCGQEAGAGAHHHTEECYEMQTTQICGQEETEGHKHTEECYEQVFTCEKEEHKHTLACYSDPNADVEDAGVWQNTVASVSLTGNWGEDLAAVAATQNGYRESEANYAVMEDGTTMNGYTRYGAWSGDAYRDNWSAQFVNFCLSYAGIPSSAIAQKPECGQWSTTTVAADGSAYAPKKGDLVILDSDHNGAADHAGVVTEVSDNGIKAIVGDLDKAVKTNTYSTGDSSVVGYVEMPENPALKSEDDADPTPEITPETTPEATSEPEPSEAPEITLVQDTLTVKIYTDSSYETELTDKTSITVSGKLPENASVKAYPIENVTMDGEEILYAWDISIYDAQGNLWEPEDGNPISVEFHVPELAEEEDYSIYYIPESDTEKDPEELQSQVTGNVISFEAEHFSVYALMRAARAVSENQEIDFKNFITSVSAQYKESEWSEEWKNIETDTQLEYTNSIRFNVNYTLPKNTLSSSKNTIIYILPDQLKDFTGSGTVEGTGGSKVGTYVISEGKVSITFIDEYVNKNQNSEIEGWLSFSEKVSEIKTDGSGKTDVKFNDKCEISLQIKGDEKKKGDITVKKNQSDIDSSNGTVRYTIEVNSEYGTNAEVVLNDVMTKLQLDGGIEKIGIVDKNGNNVNNATIVSSDDNTKIDIKLPQMEAGDKYVITYTAKLSETWTENTVTGKNCVEVSSKNENDVEIKDKAEVDTEFKGGKIEKTGKNNKDGTVTWTIIVNKAKQDISGWILEDFLNGSKLTDTDLVGDIIISPGVNGTESSKINLPYTFPEDSKDTYTITYTTYAGVSGENHTVNKAELKKDDKSFSSGDISQWISKNDLYKKTGKSVTENQDGTLTLKWNVNIILSTDMDTWEFTDTPSNGQYFTKAQIESLKTALDSAFGKNNYILSSNTSDENDQSETWSSIKITNISNGNALKKGTNISFTYETTAAKPEKWTNFQNKARFDNYDFNGEISYTPPKPVIKKVDDRNEQGGSSTSYDYSQITDGTDGILKWKITLNVTDEMKSSDTLILKEQLPEGVSLKSLKYDWQDIKINEETGEGSYSNNGNEIHVKKENNLITITIPKVYYENGSTEFIFRIEAKLNEISDWSNAKVYKNTVTVTDSNNKQYGTDDQTQTITNSAETSFVEKKGVADNNRNVVSYSVEINKKGEDLLKNGSGGTLTLEDVLTYKYNGWASGAKITLVPNSVKVYYRNTDGTKGEALSDSLWSYVYKEEGSGINNKEEDRTNTLTFTVPDDTAMFVEYEYKFNGVNGTWVAANNTATLKGNGQDLDHSESNNNIQIKDSNAGATLKGIVIYKVDASNNGHYLKGAKFALYKWDSNQNEYVLTQKNLTSDDSGEIKIDNLTHNQAYQLKEIEAPEGYEISQEVYEFYIEDTDTSKYPESKPENFNGHILSAGSVIYYPNKKSSSYILPETGGIGTDRLTAVGLSLMAGSLMCEYVLRRRRRERRRS